MSDSASKIDITQPGVFDKPAGTEMIVRGNNGEPRKIIKDEKGRFVKQRRPMPEAREVTRLMRNLLNQAEAGADGKLNRDTASRLRKMFDNIVAIATASAESPVLNKEGEVIMVDGKPLTIKDAKMAMASVKAFEALMARAYGKVPPGDEEMDALKLAGVKIVVVSPPQLMHSEVVEEKIHEPLKPSFIEGEAKIVDSK